MKVRYAGHVVSMAGRIINYGGLIIPNPINPGSEYSMSGTLRDTTTSTPQRAGTPQNFGQGDVAPGEVANIGGLNASIVGVGTNEAQSAGHPVFTPDQDEDHTAALIGGGGTGGDDGDTQNTPIPVLGASEDILGKAVRYATTAGMVPPGSALANTYLNKSDPEVTMTIGQHIFSVEP